MMMVVLSSAVLGSAGYIFSPYLLKVLGVTADVYQNALDFMHVSFIGIVFIFTYAMFQALMRGIGQVRLPLLIVLGTVLLNFLLDPLFIFGGGPVHPHGVLGAALATLTTQGLASLLGVIISLRGRHGIQLFWRNLRPDFSYIKRASIELSARGLGPMMMSFLATSFGTLTIATYGVGLYVLQAITVPAMGLSMAVSTLVGQNMGAGNINRAVKTARLGALWGFLILSTIGLVAFISASSLAAFFVSHDPQVIEDASRFIRIMSLSWRCIGLQLCLIATFRASGNTLTAMVIALVSQWVVQFPIAYVLSRHTALHSFGLWWSFPISSLVCALATIVWFAKEDWVKIRLTEEVTA
jgi:putative MATE family efflux protein